MVAQRKAMLSVASDNTLSTDYVPDRLAAALEYARKRRIELEQNGAKINPAFNQGHRKGEHSKHFRFRRNMLYSGLFILGMSLPPAFADQIFELNNVLKSHNISSHELGMIGIAIGISTIANGAINIYFERHIRKEMAERLKYIKRNDRRSIIRRN